MTRSDTLAGLHRKATPPQPKRAKIFLQVHLMGLAVWYNLINKTAQAAPAQKRKEIKMKESTQKIVMEILESELHAAEKSIHFINVAIKIATAEKNVSAIKTQERLKKHALQRIETLQNAIKDLSEK